jgi:type I restriction enzyme, S subunit
MKSAWRTVPLGDVTRLDLNRESIDPSKTYEMVGVLSFARGLFTREPIENGNTSYKHFLRLKPDHIVMSQLFGWEGALALSNDCFAGKYLSPQFPTFLSDERRLDRKFLGWLMRRPTFWSDLGTRASGMGDRRRTLNPDAFFACQIPLPPLDEQRRIAARIEELAVKVEEARSLRNGSSEGADALTKSAAAAVLEELTGTSPRQPLGSLVSIRGGGTPSKDASHYWGGTIPWITPKDMKRRALADAIDHITALAVRESPAKLLEPGAVLVVVRGMILAHTFPAAVLLAPATINQDMKALMPDARLLPEYLCFVLWAWNSHVLALVDRSGHDTRKLNTNKLLAFEIPVPTVKRQERVIEELNALQLKIESVMKVQTETSAELDAMLPAILDLAFKGKL